MNNILPHNFCFYNINILQECGESKREKTNMTNVVKKKS